MTVLGQSRMLRTTIDLADPPLVRLCQAFWYHRQARKLFPGYLMALYWSMQATVPLLRTAEQRARQLNYDPVAAQLVPYLARHAREELHHDEWLLQDMEQHLGIKRTTVLNTPPPPAVAALIGTQYFWILHAHPVALLGCFAVLEGKPVTAADLDEFSKRTRIPKEGLRTLYKHAQLDPHHRDDLDRVLDTLPLAPDHATLLGLSAITVVEQLAGVFDALLNN